MIPNKIKHLYLTIKIHPTAFKPPLKPIKTVVISLAKNDHHISIQTPKT